MLNAKQMADEIRAYREAESKEGLRLPTWRAVDTERKTRPVRMSGCGPNPVSLSEQHLIVQSGNVCFHPKVIERIDLTAPDADARLARYVETAPG